MSEMLPVDLDGKESPAVLAVHIGHVLDSLRNESLARLRQSVTRLHGVCASADSVALIRSVRSTLTAARRVDFDGESARGGWRRLFGIRRASPDFAVRRDSLEAAISGAGLRLNQWTRRLRGSSAADRALDVELGLQRGIVAREAEVAAEWLGRLAGGLVALSAAERRVWAGDLEIFVKSAADELKRVAELAELAESTLSTWRNVSRRRNTLVEQFAGDLEWVASPAGDDADDPRTVPSRLSMTGFAEARSLHVEFIDRLESTLGLGTALYIEEQWLQSLLAQMENWFDGARRVDVPLLRPADLLRSVS